MRTGLRLAALATALVSAVFWLFGGPNLGWTKTSVERWQRDPVTEIDYPVIEPRFLPGVDFLAAGLAVAVLLLGASFLGRKKGAGQAA